MKIAQLQSENFKRTVYVALDLTNKDSVTIAGRNGQGKSSILDAILVGIGGAKYAPEMPIRKGEGQAEIVLTLDDGSVVKRVFKEGKTPSLEILTPEGAKYPSPQARLESLLGKSGALPLDPLEFTRKQPREQRAIVAALAGIDLDLLDARKKEAREALRRFNADLAALQNRHEGKTLFEGVPDTPISMDELSTKLEKALTHNAAILRAQDLTESKRRELTQIKTTIRDLEERLAAAVEQGKALEQEIAQREERAKAPEIQPVDVEAIRAEIAATDEVNTKVRANAELKAARAEWESKEPERVELEKALASIEEERLKALAESKLPVEGLEFGEDEVLYNGIPLSQCSASEQLRISTAMALGMAGEFRVVLLRDASLLDEDSRALVAKLCQDAGAQLWIEIVAAEADGDEVIVIEDGQVVGADPKPEAVPA